VPITEALAACHGSIMIVDDSPANLKLLEDMLRQHGYEVQAFPRGKMALAAARQEPPDLFLLDINMPEMSGYEVCEQLKSNERLSGIPVIFLSALSSIEDKVKGFASGGVDYISKPFQFEEVQARVDTHLELRQARRAEHDLLEGTLGGIVETLWELVQLTSPVLALRSRAVRDIVLWMSKRMRIKNPWQYELAATLCLVGCVALPDEVFERAYCGQNLSPDEEKMFRAHPETTARLFSKIPRLDVVAGIIRGQQGLEAEASVAGNATQGAQVLHLAMELDRRLHRGVTARSALAELRVSSQFDPGMLEALDSYSPAKAEFDVRRVPIQELRNGMVLENDVWSKNGKLLILLGGTILTETWIQRLVNFAKLRCVEEVLSVRVPRLARASRVEESGYAVPGTLPQTA
jgi:DNA-binding response OmpR family regulator